MGNPLVTVVLCVYNGGDYLAFSIKSILEQTYSNFEFIIWDDGSSDGTKEIVKSFSDKRIKYIYHENTGLGMALRLACARAKGKYIARMDSDDICFPNRFEIEVDYLERHEDCVLVSSAINYINDKGDIMGRSFPYSKDRIIKDALRIPSSYIVHPMAMIRRDAYEKAGGYLPIRKSQDVLFWSRLSKQGKFYNISSPLGGYRVLQSSLDHEYNPYKPVLMSLLKKMVMSDVVTDDDINLYNDIFVYSKKESKHLSISTDSNYKKKIDERIYDILKLIVGKQTAERMVVFIKDRGYIIRHSI